MQFLSAGQQGYVAVNDPSTFCQDNPALATSCFVAGNQVDDQNNALSTVRSINYDWGSSTKNISTTGTETLDSWQVDGAGNPNDPRDVALANQVGSVWGEAWDKNKSVMYVSSYLKQFAGYGPAGPNAIYQIPMDPYTGLATGAPTVFATVGTSTGRNPATGAMDKTFAATGGTDAIDVCDDNHTTDLANPVFSQSVFSNVMRCSFGGMDTNTDGTRLYVTSLKGKEILEFDTATGQMVDHYPFPVATLTFCPNLDAASEAWPFAAKWHDGKLFVGGTCSGQTGGYLDVWFWVFSLDPATGAWTKQFDMQAEPWRYFAEWTDDYMDLRRNTQPDDGANLNYQTDYTYHSDGQLADIEFFGSDMTLGIRNRAGDQWGYRIPDAADPDPGTIETLTITGSGDLICVDWNGTSYVRESGGSCGAGRQWQSTIEGQAPTSYAGGSPGRGDGEPEFYWGDGANDVYRGDPTTPEPQHEEPVFGGLAQVNTSPLAFTGLNPPDALGGELIDTGGIGFADSVNGSTFRAYLIYQAEGVDGFAQPYFGKANGLGDLEQMCVAAPIEIGNRLWFDADSDGIQDAGEAPVVGATVRLYDSTGALLATATTDAQGRYVFVSSGADGLPGNADDIFAAGDAVTVRVDNPADFATGGVLDGWSPTAASATDGSTPTDDDQDSDGVVGNTLALTGSSTLAANSTEIPVTIGVAGDNNHTYDFGFTQADYSLGNLVWNDANNDGLVSAGEAGIDGVHVTLWLDADGDGTPDSATPVAEQDTNSGGFYLFTGLNAGTYLVEIAAPSGFVSSTGAGATDASPTYEPAPDPDTTATDSDDNGTATTTSIMSAPVTLGDGEPTGETATPGHTDTAPDGNSNLTVDFGIYRPYAIGNVVWNDVNNNGVQDSGEPGLNGVTVNLLDASGNLLQSVVTATNDVDGEYRFVDLPAGDYIVEIVAPAGYSSSTGASDNYEPAPDPDTDVNLDDNGTFDAASGTIRSGVVTLGPGDEPIGEEPGANDPADNSYNKTVDFGLYQSLSLGDLVWNDTNDNGVVDTGESGIAGVTVNLYTDPDGDGTFDTPAGTTQTDTNGNYLFSDLTPGDYVVGFELPTGTRSSTDAATGADPDDDVNNDDNVAGTGTGEQFTKPITLAAGLEPTNDGDTSSNSNLSVDAGVFTPAPAVTLKKYTNGCDAQTGTGAAGPTAACPGDDGANNPVVAVGAAITWTYVVTNTGNVKLTDVTVTDDKVAATDIDCGDGSNGVAELLVGESITCTATGTATAGQYANTGAVNATGETTPGTSGALTEVTDPSHYFAQDPGITLKKYTNTSATQAFAGVDDADVATGVDPTGNHVVPVGTSLWWVYVVENTGNVDLTNVVVTDDKGVAVTCPANTLAIGETMTCTAQGTLAAAGQYTNVGTVTATAPGVTTPLTASDPSNAYGYNASIDVEKHTNGIDADTAAEGPTVGLGSQVTWTYLVHNTGNITLANIVVTDDIEGTITCPATVLAADDGAAGGPDEMTCTKTGVAIAGQYANNATVTGVPAGTDGTPIPGGEPVTDEDPSHYTGVTASIGDLVWEDLDADGIQDPGEPGVAGVTVILYDADGNEVGRTETGPDGTYLFDGLEPGDYHVVFEPPAGWNISTPSQGTDPALDSNADPTTGAAPVTTLDAGETDLTWDAGIWRPVSLGNLVWFDTNNNGVVDGTEAGLDGRTVTLLRDLDGDGTFSDVIATQQTSDGGYYLFTGLKPGDYVVRVTVAANETSSTGGGSEPAPDADTDADDSDDNGTATTGFVISTPVTLLSGEPTGEPATPGHADTTADDRANYTVDFGIIEYVSLGDVVFYDNNDNGTLDTGELGVPDVPVRLLSDPDGDGTFDHEVATDVTDTNGNYLFDQLVPGTYVVEFVLPTDYRSSTDIATTADANNDVNSDDNIVGTGAATVLTSPVTLTPRGEPITDGDTSSNSNLTVDAGIFKPAPAVALKKYTNGCDAQAATGVTGPTAACPSDDGNNNPVVAEGAAITWTYVVTNTGNVPLTNVTVTDDKVAASAIKCDDDNVVASLAPGQSVTCTATGTAVKGQYANNGTVTAEGEQPPGTTTPEPLTDTDPSHYYGDNPGLALKKYTTTTEDLATTPADDADTAGGLDTTANHVVKVGTKVWWHYVIENTGDVTISNIKLVDDKVGDITCPATTLAAGATMICVASGTIDEAGQYANVATVTGESASGTQLDASDPSHVFAAEAKVDVEKHTNGVDADDAADAVGVVAGQPVTWTYHVHNTGNTWLVNVKVVDDKEGDVPCPKTTLAPDDGAAGGLDEMDCTITGVAKNGSYTNNATVTGTPAGPDGTPIPGVDPVDDEDPSNYVGVPIIIGDTVWLDEDHDGAQDSNEPGIGGVVLELVDADGNTVGTTTTDENGHYQFDDTNVDGGLKPDTEYTITFPDENYAPDGPLEGLTPTVIHTTTPDLDSNLEEDGTIPVSTPSKGADLTFDAGFYFDKSDLTIEKELDHVDGTKAYFTILVTNLGPATVRPPIQVVDTPPAELVALDATGDGWVCEVIPTKINCSLDERLSKDESAPVINVTMELADPADANGDEYVNHAHVSGPNVNETNLDNNDDDAAVSFTPIVLNEAINNETPATETVVRNTRVESSPVARTGSDIAALLMAGGAAILIGGGLVSVMRRRRDGKAVL